MDVRKIIDKLGIKDIPQEVLNRIIEDVVLENEEDNFRKNVDSCTMMLLDKGCDTDEIIGYLKKYWGYTPQETYEIVLRTKTVEYPCWKAREYMAGLELSSKERIRISHELRDKLQQDNTLYKKKIDYLVKSCMRK